MKKKSLTENFIYNMLYQVLVTALPIITTPYIARVLGLHANGIHSYTEGIVTYFMLFGALGTALYGTRKIAYDRGNSEKLKQSTWEIILLRFLLMGVTLGVYVITLCFHNEYAYLYRIQIINILATAIDLSWFFQGVEDFKRVTMRNMLVKAIYVVALFLFIKKPSDLSLYVFLIVGSTFLGNIIMWFYLKEYLTKGKIQEKVHLLQHLKGSISLFVPQITNYVYALLDRSMLKWITGETDNVGIYDQAQRLVRAITAILQSLGYVMLARISNLLATEHEEEARHYIRKSINFTMFLAFPIMFGLMGTAEDFVPIFLGEEYTAVIPVLQLISPLVLTAAMNSVMGVQILIPMGKEKQYAVATSSGAVVNVIINLIAIPSLGVAGACVSSLLAEAVVFTISFVNARKYIDIKGIVRDNLPALITGFIMFLGVRGIRTLAFNSYVRLLIEVTAGAVFYFIVMIIMKNETMSIILEKFFSYLKSKR